MEDEESREIITLTGLPLGLIPPDTPKFLTDLTWNAILEGAASGIPITKTLKNIGCDPIVYGKVMRWIHKDEARYAEYLRVREIGTHVLSDEMIEISDGNDGHNGMPEDTARSTLRINVRKFLMDVYNRNLFGKKTEVNVTTLDLTKAIKEAEARTITITDE